MFSAILAATVLLVQAAPAATESSVSPSAAAPAGGTAVSPVTVTGVKPAKAAPKPDELVCRTEVVLGTLFPKKICARRDELADRQRTDQAELRRNTALRPWKDGAN